MSRRDRWNERYAAKDLVWSAGPNQLFASEVAGLSPGTALDVACGEGRNALWLAEQGWQVTGVDFSDVGIDKARRIAERRSVSVHWMVGDAATVDLPEQGFDLVCVLYLHTDPATRLAWLARVTKAVRPGGTFIYIGHDPSNIKHGVGGPQDASLLPGLDELRSALTGFRVESAAVVERPVENDPGHGGELSGIALDTFVKAIRPI
jgi:SAM-dependent methyltransferase